MRGPWEFPEPRPLPFRDSEDGKTIHVLDSVSMPRELPRPVLGDETSPMPRLSASVMFQLHPLAAAHVLSTSVALIRESGVAKALTQDEQAALGVECWRLALAVVRPGMPVRAAVEQALAEGVFEPRLSGVIDAHARVLRRRITLLGGWFVVQAIDRWSATD